jgi:hypothetical protein
MEWVATDRFKKSLQPPRSSDRRLLQQNRHFCDLGDQLPLVGFRIDCGHPEGFATLAKISRMAHGVSLFGLLISLFP